MMHRLLRGSPRLLGVVSKRGNASWIVHTVPTPELTSDLVRRPLPKMMLGEVAKHRDEAAIVDGATGASLTFATVHAHVYCLANALRRVLGPAGGPIACIGIVSPNHLNYFTIFNAIALVGARSTTLNPLCTEDDALYQLEATGCRAAFVHPACVAKVQAAVARMRGGGAAFTIISMDAAAAGAATSVDEMVAGERLADIDEDSFLPQATFDPESILTIPFSSGTTGKPKGVVLTHRNVVSNILQSYPFEGEQLRPSAANNFKRGTMLVPLPFFHIFGLTSGMCIPFYMGAQMVFMPAFDLKHYLTLVQQYKVTRGFVVPPIVLALAKHPMVDEYDLSSLESLMSGAAPLGAEVQIAAASRLKCIIKQGWGMTETSPAGTITPDWLITTVADVAGISGKLVSRFSSILSCHCSLLPSPPLPSTLSPAGARDGGEDRGPDHRRRHAPDRGRGAAGARPAGDERVLQQRGSDESHVAARRLDAHGGHRAVQHRRLAHHHGQEQGAHQVQGLPGASGGARGPDRRHAGRQGRRGDPR
jgi:acyl-CoA synthetase (AMP-forming)/AMP-acid ligase II